ncbi:MAG: hypothetical protein Q7T71_10330, partial [Herbiconiux sp.]|nr:hypothetical protein [Herbiconiux sp.]
MNPETPENTARTTPADPAGTVPQNTPPAETEIDTRPETDTVAVVTGTIVTLPSTAPTPVVEHAA